MPASIFLNFNLPNATTWFYLSALLAIALFYQFHRLLSLLNWDLVALFMLVPGLLILQEFPATNPMSDQRWIGYLWLLVGTWYYFARCMLDLALIRRPALHPNLNLPGLAWLTGMLLVCLGGVALRPETGPESQVGRGSEALDASQRQMADLVMRTAGWNVPRLDGRGTKYWIERGLAGACHLAVVVALILIGVWHFQDVRAGMAAATLYLLLPYVAFYVTQIHHVLPTALLLWAIVYYRHPIVAGALVGAATGSLFFPAVTLPVWVSFYWKRGARRFLGAVAVTAGVSLILTVALLWWDGRIGVVWQTISQPDWLPWRAPQNASEGFWGGIHWAYRIPVFTVYLSFLAATAFWPSPKNLAHLLALLAAVLLGIQFWYADQGGVYVLWYLPILLLVVLRPNLSDRRPPIPESEDDFVVRTYRRIRQVIRRFTQRPEPVVR